MILDRIIADNRAELEARKRSVPLNEIKALALQQPPAIDFASRLRGDRVRLIAEVKKASPSRGVICADFDPVAIAQTYARNGASAISVLTETKYFQGSLNHLKSIRDVLGDKRPPLLRKDFIIDAYQIYEARAYGADAMLLIAAILDFDRLQELLGLSHELGMKCLVEVHSQVEVAMALTGHAKIIGINNRDLNTFAVDIDTTRRLRPLIPPDRIVVSESGIKDTDDMKKMREWGVDAVLVGETLMSADDIAAKMRELSD